MQKLHVLISVFITIQSFGQTMPKQFVYLKDIDATIQSELVYCSNNNFIGKPILGYLNDRVIVSKKTALALQKIQVQLKKQHYSLKIFDAYRPQQAVDYFVNWANDLQDTIMKSKFYPKVSKKNLFKKGFIASKSGHTRGSTVDLTIIHLSTGKEMDMGSSYDFFGKESHPFYTKISIKQQKNRLFLRNIMLANGFLPYDNEWWHFTLKNEPFPYTYFNFPVQ